MRHSPTNLSRNLSLILICAALGACASTQKSGSGAGAAEQSAAPISDASKSGAAGAQDSTGASTAAAPAESATPSSGLPDTGAGAAATAGSASATDHVPQATSEEAAQLKRQLEDQDAQINKLRTDQQAAAREEEAARQAQEQQAAAASQASQTPATGAKSSASQDAAAFPPDANAGGRAAAPAGETAAAPAGEMAAAPAGTLERSVYFDYDQARVPEKYDPMLMANAAYLKAHPSLKTEVQGNCDERGSREYNLALGARRAQAVKRALELAGADGHRIGVVSFGAEKPIALGKDEDSYSKNRRADIVY